MSFALSRDGLSDQVRLAHDASRLRKLCFLIVDALQHDTRTNGGDKIIATAVSLVAMCQATNCNFNDVVTKALNIMGDVQGPFEPHLRAVREYARDHLRSR